MGMLSRDDVVQPAVLMTLLNKVEKGAEDGDWIRLVLFGLIWVDMALSGLAGRLAD